MKFIGSVLVEIRRLQLVRESQMNVTTVYHTVDFGYIQLSVIPNCYLVAHRAKCSS